MVSKQKSKWKKAQKKSKYIDRWAETMTKHGIVRETKKGNQWRFLNFRDFWNSESTFKITGSGDDDYNKLRQVLEKDDVQA